MVSAPNGKARSKTSKKTYRRRSPYLRMRQPGQAGDGPPLTVAQQIAICGMLTGLTIAESAEQAGVHRNTVHRWLRDERFRATIAAGRRQRAEGRGQKAEGRRQGHRKLQPRKTANPQLRATIAAGRQQRADGSGQRAAGSGQRAWAAGSGRGQKEEAGQVAIDENAESATPCNNCSGQTAAGRRQRADGSGQTAAGSGQKEEAGQVAIAENAESATPCNNCSGQTGEEVESRGRAARGAGIRRGRRCNGSSVRATADATGGQAASATRRLACA